MATVTDSQHTHDTPLTNQHLGHLLHLASSPLAPRVGRQLVGRQLAGGRRRWCVGATLTSTPIPVLCHCTSFDTFLPSSLSWQANSCRQTGCKLLWYWIKMDLLINSCCRPFASPTNHIWHLAVFVHSFCLEINKRAALFESRIKLCVCLGEKSYSNVPLFVKYWYVFHLQGTKWLTDPITAWFYFLFFLPAVL